jgi:hypothetical protein
MTFSVCTQIAILWRCGATDDIREALLRHHRSSMILSPTFDPRWTQIPVDLPNFER